MILSKVWEKAGKRRKIKEYTNATPIYPSEPRWNVYLCDTLKDSYNYELSPILWTLCNQLYIMCYTVLKLIYYLPIQSLQGKVPTNASDQIRSVTQSCPTLCDPMNRSTPGLPDHHQLPEFTQTHVHRVIDAIQPSHPLSSPSPLASNPSQHQSLFQWVNSSHEVAKVLEFQL